MRINSPEAIRRMRGLLRKYGSYENVAREMRLRADALVAKTLLRLKTRPVICPKTNSITFEVEFLKPKDQRCFFMLRINGYTVNGETLENRNHMISEDVVCKKSLFRKATYKYRLFMRCDSQNQAFAAAAQKLWDENEEALKAGKTEILMYLPTKGEGKPNSRGYSNGKVAAGPANVIK